jgi:acyl carrier protein
MAAGLERSQQAHGMGMIPPAQGRQIFGYLYQSEQGQIGVVPFEAPTVTREAVGGQGELRLRLAQCAADERASYLMEWIAEQVALTLGLGRAKQVPLQQPLFELGIDSLMALELRNQVVTKLGTAFPSTLFFEYPTVEGVATWILTELQFETAVADTKEVKAFPQGQRANSTYTDALADLSAEELLALIEEEFSNTKRGGAERD